jgi:hypothetical protein
MYVRYLSEPMMLRGTMTPRVVRVQNMVMSLEGLGTKNECAGKDKQQFALPA